VIFEAHAIPNLIYIDTDDCRRYTMIGASAALHSALIINPDHLYEPLQKASEFYRAQGKKGLIYPSARHSCGHALALFDDHSRSLVRIVKTLQVFLSLVDEEKLQPVAQPFNPDTGKISYTQGYYQFSRNDYLANKSFLQSFLPDWSGIIDFVRRNYSTYPDDAVR